APVAGAADAGASNAVLGVMGDQQRRRFAGGVLTNDVGERVIGWSVDFAHVVEVLGVGAPHRGVVLTIEGGQSAVVRAVGVANPDVVIGRAAVASAVPCAGAANVSDLIALGGEDALASLGDGDSLGTAAFCRHRIELVA